MIPRILILLLLFTVPVSAEYFGPKDTATGSGYALGDITMAQEWRCVHNGTIDSVYCNVEVHFVDDTTWFALMASTSGEPGALIARTTEYHTGTGTGYIALAFPAETNVSENTNYFIVTEHRSGNAGFSRLEKHKDTLRQEHWFYYLDTLETPWPTGTDTETDGSSFQFAQVYYTPTVSYDTTVRDSSHTMTKDNHLDSDGAFGPWPNHGTSATLKLGQETGGGPGLTMRAVVSTEDATEAYIEAFFDDTADIAVICTVMFDWSSQVGVDADDSFYLYALMVQFDELLSHWKNSDTNVTWGSDGADLSGTDHYAMKLGGFIESDTATNGYYVFTNDTSNYGPILQMCDSLIGGNWGVYGFYLREKTTLVEGEVLQLTSGESGSAPPYFSYSTLALTQQAAAGAAIKDRHGADDRHGAIRH